MFQNLSNQEVMQIYYELWEIGYSEEDIFNFIYEIDCYLDKQF